MRITRAVIPAGGRGTRLYPLTKSQPKEMLPLGTIPTIQGVAEEMVAAGVTDILIVTGEGKGPIEDHFDPVAGLCPSDFPDAEPSPVLDGETVRFSYTRQGEPLGLGDAISHGRQFAGDSHVLVALGDCIITCERRGGALRRMVEAHVKHEAAASILVQRVSIEDTSRYGIVDPGAQMGESAFEMADIVEKPGPDRAPSRFAVAARYAFSPMIFDYLAGLEPGVGGEIQLTDAIRAMVADGHRVLGVPLRGGERRLDVGNLGSYSRAFVRTMLTHDRHGEDLRRYTANLLAHIDDPAHPDPDLPDDQTSPS